MKREEVNDLTDQFDRRLADMERSRTPRDELDAAITVYERVRTAMAICQALLPAGCGAAEVVAVAVEIGRVKQSGQAVATRE